MVMHQDAARADFINVFALDFEVVNPLGRRPRLDLPSAGLRA
jgi:hypothetical protein